MPVVEDVLSHWVDLYSTSLDEVEYHDHLFYFGLKNTRDILVTTSLSALTLGVDLDNRQVGSIGTRVYNYWDFEKAVLQYKLLPPSYEWNSEDTADPSVRVRTAVFFASGTSLSNAYASFIDLAYEKAMAWYSTKAVIAFVRRGEEKEEGDSSNHGVRTLPCAQSRVGGNREKHPS